MDTQASDMEFGELYKAGAFSSRFGAIYWDDVGLDGRSNALVKGLLSNGEFSVVMGDSATGKTFFMFDLAAHVALGWPWRDHKIDQGVVIYIALEGGHGFKKRIVAFQNQHGLADERPPFVLIPQAVDLLHTNIDLDALIGEIDEIKSRFALPVRLIVIDTLSRALSGGNENSSDDMGAFVMNCDRIRQSTGAHVCAIHHTGKDASKGARGHSLLRAAIDTEITVEKLEEGGSVATVTKQKDLEMGGTFPFRLERVVLGQDEDGDDITSCVVEPAEDAVRKTKIQKLTPRERKSLDILKSLLAENGELRQPRNEAQRTVMVSLVALRDRLSAMGVTDRNEKATERAQWSAIRQAPVSKEVIGIWEDWVWVT